MLLVIEKKKQVRHIHSSCSFHSHLLPGPKKKERKREEGHSYRRRVRKKKKDEPQEVLILDGETASKAL
jgi:hypothetical protein